MMQPVKLIIATTICGIIALSIPAQAASESEAKTTAAAPATGKTAECHGVAKVFGATICQEQLSPPEAGKNRPGNAAAKPNPQIVGQQKGILRNIIWQSALIHKFGDAAAPPSMEEIDTYRKGFDRTMDSSYEADRKTVDFIQGLLDKYNYSPENEERLKQILNVTQASLKLYSERQQHTQTLPKEYQFVVDTAERAIARNMLTAWKDDKILYEAYHGRLALFPGGVVPIDAYAAFLKYIKDEGKLTILDPQYDDVMGDIEKQVAQNHHYMADDNFSKNYFTKPDWQFTLANSSDRFNELKTHLETVPNLGPKPGVDVKEEELIGKQSRPGGPLPAPTPGQDGKDATKQP